MLLAEQGVKRLECKPDDVLRVVATRPVHRFHDVAQVQRSLGALEVVLGDVVHQALEERILVQMKVFRHKLHRGLLLLLPVAKLGARMLVKRTSADAEHENTLLEVLLPALLATTGSSGSPELDSGILATRERLLTSARALDEEEGSKAVEPGSVLNHDRLDAHGASNLLRGHGPPPRMK